MPFEVTFDDQPYPLPPELVPPPLGLLPADEGPDKLALFEALGRLQRDLSRLSGRLQLNIKSQQEGQMKVEEAMGALESRFREASLVKPPPPPVVTGGGASLEQLTPHLAKLSEQLVGIQRKVNPLSEQLEAVKGSYREKVEESQIERILPVLDSFERLFEQAGQSEDPKMQKWLEGVRMIYNQLRSFLRGQGVEEIPALGEVFDPKLFAAVGTDPTDAYPPNVVSRVGRTGYRRQTESGTKILRVPEVFVAKPPTEAMRLDESQLTRAEILEQQRREDAGEVSASSSSTSAPPPATAAPPAPLIAAPPAPSPAPVVMTEPAPEPPPALVAESVAEPAAAEDLLPDPATLTIGPGEDKFADIRAKAEAALKGLFEPAAHLESAHPTPVAEPPAPSVSPSQQTSFAGWGGLGTEATVPDTPPQMPAVEGGVPMDAPPLEGGGEEYYASGDGLYELRMARGLSLADFWGHAFGKQLGDQQLMDLGEAVEREEECIDEKELRRLAQGLGLTVEDLLPLLRRE
ncbi:MAG: Protein GrpE [bacterium]|nr:Protein GrpE [bacterium]